jgi:phosphoglycolate phosphatase
VRAVLFDFDYTLADSSDAIVECFGAGLAAVGLPAVAPERIRRTIGLPLPEALRTLHGVADAALAARFREGFHALAERIMHERTRVFAPVAEVTGALRAAGLATAICSTKRRGQIERILARHALLDRFDAIVGGEDVPRHKPAPDALLLALERLGVEAERALYVGDHRVDADAAAGAGVPFVAVLSGPSPQADFAGATVRAFLGSVAELPGLLGGGAGPAQNS